jgi:hypothetical protein
MDSQNNYTGYLLENQCLNSIIPPRIYGENNLDSFPRFRSRPIRLPVFPAAAPTSAHTERAASDAGDCPLAAAIHNEGALPFFSGPI